MTTKQLKMGDQVVTTREESWWHNRITVPVDAVGAVRAITAYVCVVEFASFPGQTFPYEHDRAIKPYR